MYMHVNIQSHTCLEQNEMLLLVACVNPINYGNQDFFPLANGDYFKATIKKTPL